MKKKYNLKRFIAGLVSSAMVMASFVFPVTNAKADDTINMNPDSLSLTIYKYGTDNGDSEGDGTGVDLGSNAPTTNGDNAYEALAGVEFTVYKIADISQENNSIKYNKIVGIGLDDFSEELSGSLVQTKIDDIYNSIKDNSNVFKRSKSTTVSSNMVKFSDEDSTLNGVGLYLVAETDWPDKVTSTMKPFLVSLPSTIKTTVAGVTSSEWIYDVYAYPKNSTMVSGITIQKTKADGSGLAGAEFSLEKLTDSGYEIQTADADGNAYDNVTANKTFKTNGVGKITFSGLAPAKYRIIEWSAPDNTYIVESDLEYKFEITSGGKVMLWNEEDNGYTTEKTDSTITIVNEQPTIKKTVLTNGGNVDDQLSWVEFADYSFGKDIQFKIEITIPDNINKLDVFKITDEFEEGVFGSVTKFDVVGIKDSNESSLDSFLGKIDQSNSGWTFDLKTSGIALSDYDSLEITYKAVFNKSNNTNIGATPNTNTATLTYKNHIYSAGGDNPVSDPDSTDDNTTTITDSANVYTFSLELIKTFEGETTLNNEYSAVFKLYDNADNEIGEYTASYDNTDGKVKVKVDGLSNGIYYLKEIDTVNGYNLLRDRIEVGLNVAYDKSLGTITNEDEVVKSITVENKKGFSFPVTGGRGTIIFTITGLTLMIIAVCIFFTSRKRKTN